jgi:hypothetical protein
VNCSTASGTITIDGHPGNNFAWCCVNLDDLWDDVSLRGDDLIVPDAHVGLYRVEVEFTGGALVGA